MYTSFVNEITKSFSHLVPHCAGQFYGHIHKNCAWQEYYFNIGARGRGGEAGGEKGTLGHVACVMIAMHFFLNSHSTLFILFLFSIVYSPTTCQLYNVLGENAASTKEPGTE